MHTRTLGPGGLEVSALGLGCMGMSQGYGATDDAESIATLHAALDAGITLLDTAQSYGSGANERLLAPVLSARRDEIVLATKFGIVRDADGVHVDARPDRVRDYLESSLQRLGVDHVDLYYLHRVDPDVPIEESIGAMAQLVAAGKVGHLGVSEVTAEQLERAVAVHPIAAVQTEWSLTWRDVEDEVRPAARRLGVAIVPYSPLGRGLLTGALPAAETFGDGDMRRSDPRFAGAAYERNLALVDAVAEIAAQHAATPAQLALAWLLHQGDDVVPIPGTKRRSRLAENVAAADLRLSADDLRRLEEVAPRDGWEGDRASFAVPVTERAPAT
jgi:aryl-alcohol dehydrogenase-like predicted oxidoreductase